MILFRYSSQIIYLEFDWVEFFLLQVVSEHVSVDPLLLQSKFTQGVLPDPAVPVGHTQRAASLAGHTGEALPSAEVVHCHILEMHPPRPQALLPLQYWFSCKGKWQRAASYMVMLKKTVRCTLVALVVTWFWQFINPIWKELQLHTADHCVKNTLSQWFFKSFLNSCILEYQFYSQVKPIKISDIFIAKWGTRVCWESLFLNYWNMRNIF